MYFVRVYYVCPDDVELRKTLEDEYQVPCQFFEKVDKKGKDRFVFEVSDLHPRLEELEKILPASTLEENANKDHRDITKVVLISYYPRYSEEERLSAQWLAIRNVTRKIMPSNCETVDGHQCFVKYSKLGEPLGRHEIQNEPYVIKSPIKWGRSAFVSAYCHEERLFCSSTIRVILESENVTGIGFRPVLKKATMQPMEDIFQLEFTHMIPDGAVVPVDRVEEFRCEQCGMHMIRFEDGRSFYGLLKGVLDENVDFWVTQPMFLGPSNTAPLRGSQGLIISQRIYRILREKKLDRGFAFTPLKMVDP